VSARASDHLRDELSGIDPWRVPGRLRHRGARLATLAALNKTRRTRAVTVLGVLIKGSAYIDPARAERMPRPR